MTTLAQVSCSVSACPTAIQPACRATRPQVAGHCKQQLRISTQELHTRLIP